MLDITPPKIAISSNASSLRSSQTAIITFTLSEPSTNFELSDVYVVDGTLSNFSGAGVSYSAVFTPTSNTESLATIYVDTNKFTDSSGNSNADGTDSDNKINISIDTFKPYIFSGANGKSIQLGMSQTIQYQLNEASIEFAINDISIVGGSLSNFSSTTSSIYLVSVTPTSTQTSIISLNVLNGSYRDAAGNYNEERTESLRVLTVINSEIIGTSLNDQIVGTNGNDHIETSSGNDTVRAGEGNDEVNGRPSFEKGTPYSTNYYTVSLLAYMGGGDDFLFGGYGADKIFGEDGNDELYGNDGNDYLDGGSGNDYLKGAAGDDTLIGGDGDDVIGDGRGNNQLFGGNGNDELNGLWISTGDLGLQSKFYGESGNDTLYGSKGNDQLNGGAGDDWIYGGWGGTSDTAYYAGNFSQFAITVINDNSGPFLGNFRVVDLNGTEGTDTISGTVEFLNFNNGKTIVTLNNGSYTYKTLNSSPTGSVKIAGYLGVGSIINVTNTLSDEDGIGPIKYQWLASLDGEKWLELGTGTTLPVGLNAAGNLLKVKATYTDFNGTIESVSSEQTIRIPDQIRRQSNNISLIVDKGVLGENAVLLNDLLEVKVWKNNRLVSQTIDYQNITYNFRDFELVSSIVIRNGDFTDDFKFEIDNYLQRNANLSLSTAIEIVGSLNFDQILLKIAGSDGNFVG